MRRFLILMSPQGYEMSKGIVDDPDAFDREVPDDEAARDRAKVMLTFELERELSDNDGYRGDSYIITQKAKNYQKSVMNRSVIQGGGFDLGSQMAYHLRKTHAQVPGQKEFVFALNQDDMNWIYQRDGVSAGWILGELFVGTKSNEFVKKEIEDPRKPGTTRLIVGYNKNTEEAWDGKLEYDLEEFHDVYSAKMKARKRRENRGSR